MNLRKNAITAGLVMVVMIVLLGILYPLAVTGVSQVLFPGNANGQQIHSGGKLIGSKLIGQSFSDPKIKNGKAVEEEGEPVTEPDPRYFQTRPSATAPADNAAATTFSNLGPNNKTTEEAIAEHVKAYLEMERPYDPSLTAAQVPVDAADSSASGVDPQISQANARIQAHRVAAVRHLPLQQIMRLVSQNTAGRSLGIFGEPGVNVLELNLALDRLTGRIR
jgi:K+-transporting ATPase ATPase C chain